MSADSDPRPSPSVGSRPDSVEKLIGEYLDRLNAGERLDPRAILAENPIHGGAILEALESFVELGGKAETEEPLGTLGDYTLRRQIGRGGMGVVYEAWENSMDRRVALKMLPTGAAADERTFHRFMREAQIAGKLSHPNVVPVYGVGIRERTPYYAMEFVEGETLAKVLAKVREAPPESDTAFGKKDRPAYFERIAEVFADVADGLQHAHSKNITHRDIKPSNLILEGGRDREGSDHGRLRILDFGLARLEGQESLTISGDLLGTPQYMSPEQAQRKKIAIDHRTDIYSLGATLYEALTGRPPFKGKDYNDTLSKIIEHDPVELRKTNPRVPKDLETIVLKCLRKGAGDRYGTAEALGQDLRRYVRGDPIEARPEARWERLARLVARRRRVVITSLLLLLAFASLTALLGNLRQRDLEERAKRYRSVVEEAILAIELAHSGPVGWEDMPTWDRSPSDVDEWFGHHQGELLERAVSALRQVAHESPHRPEAHYHAARALRLLRRDAEADRELGAARLLDLGQVLPCLLENEFGEPDEGSTWSARWMRLRSEDRPIAERLRGYGDLARELRLQGEPYAGLQLELRIEQGRAALNAGEHLRAVEIFGSLNQERPEAYTTALLLARAYYLLGDRAQARRVADDALRSSVQTSEAAAAFADLHVRFGEKDRAREAIHAIPDRLQQIRAELLHFGRSMSREEVLALDAELAAAPVRGPAVHQMRSELSWVGLGEPHRGVTIAEEGLRSFPRSGLLHETLGWSLFYLCEFEQSIAAFEQGMAVEPGLSRLKNGVGFAQYRLGNLEASEAAFTEAVRTYPRLPFPWYGRGKARWIRGDLTGAVDDLVQCLLLDAGNSRAAYCLVQILGNGREDLMQPHWAALERSLSRALSRQVKYSLLLGLLAMSELHGSAADARRALVHAEEAIAVAKIRKPWLLDCLAQAQLAAGDPRSAVATLERAGEWADVHPSLARRLEIHRQSLGGALLTCRSIDDSLAEAFAMSEAERNSLLFRSRSSLRLRGDLCLLHYLESRVAIAEGNAQRSLDLLEQAMKQEGLDDETATVHLAELQSQVGQHNEALRLLEDRVLPGNSSPGRWAAWLRIAAMEPALPLSELLEREVLNGQPAASLAGDVRWALTELVTAGTLRINCDGGEYTDALGQRWGADRFFCSGEAKGGKNSACAPGNVPDPTIYRTQRWAHAQFGYRIPVPPGHYELAVHFFEVWGKPGGQRFDVLLNGSPLLEGQVVRPPERPFDARVERFEINAPEGIVSLLFVPREGYVSVAGIELQRRDR